MARKISSAKVVGDKVVLECGALGGDKTRVELEFNHVALMAEALREHLEEGSGDSAIEKFLKKSGGVASVSEVADVLELDEGHVRKWARENSVRRIGSTFVFGRETASALVADLLPEEDDDDNDNETE